MDHELARFETEGLEEVLRLPVAGQRQGVDAKTTPSTGFVDDGVHDGFADPDPAGVGIHHKLLDTGQTATVIELLEDGQRIAEDDTVVRANKEKRVGFVDRGHQTPAELVLGVGQFTSEQQVSPSIIGDTGRMIDR